MDRSTPRAPPRSPRAICLKGRSPCLRVERQDGGERIVLGAGGHGEDGVYHPALGDGDAEPETRVGVDGVGEPAPRYLAHVGQKRVRERPCSGDGDGGRHVLYAVVDDACLPVCWLGEGGRAGSLDAAALIDVDVDYYASLLHSLDGSAVDEVRRLGADDEDRAYEQVGTQGGVPYGHAARGQGADTPQAELFEISQTVEVAVYYYNPRPQTAGDPGCGRTYDPAAKYHNAPWSHARRTTEEDAPPARLVLQVVGPDLGREAARDLAHRCEDGEFPPRIAYRLHREGDAAGIDESSKEALVNGQGEEGEEDQTLPQVSIFLLDRARDLDDQLGIVVDAPRLPHNDGAGCRVLLVGDARGLARPLLYEHPVSCAD